MSKKLNFYFDFLSPFSFFAWKNHLELLPKELEVIYKPVLMGRLFSNFNFPGPGEIEVKRNYELKKCFRYAALNNIDFIPPKEFPFNPLGIIRTATIAAAGTEQEKVIECIFSEIWQKGSVLEDPEKIENCLKLAGVSHDIFEKSFSKPAKLELKQNIKDALEAEIFGVPSFQIGDEYFWGNDSFNDLNRFLSGNDNWDRNLYNDLIKK